MAKNELNSDYFKWICQLVCSDQYEDRINSYSYLLKHLHKIDFYYIIDMDGNRYEDGIDLRYRYSYEMGLSSAEAGELDRTEGDCSILELIAALSLRCEEQIMNDPVYGDRLEQWFWEMIESLGLSNMDNTHYYPEYVDATAEIFMKRQYERNGKGGLFTFDNNRRDMRTVEIWSQMCWHLNDIIREEESDDE